MSTRGTYPNYITGVMDRFEHDFNILELMSNYIIRLTGYLVTIQDDFSVQASKGVCSRRKILSRKFEVDGIKTWKHCQRQLCQGTPGFQLQYVHLFAKRLNIHHYLQALYRKLKLNPIVLIQVVLVIIK